MIQEDENTEQDLKKEMDDLLLTIIALYVKSSLQKLDVETMKKGPDRGIVLNVTKQVN